MERKITEAKKININIVYTIFLLICTYGVMYYIHSDVEWAYNPYQKTFNFLTFLKWFFNDIFWWILVSISGIVFHRFIINQELILTNKRILGRTIFGKAFELTNDEIMQVTIYPLGTICIHSKGKKYSLIFIKNVNDYLVSKEIIGGNEPEFSESEATEAENIAIKSKFKLKKSFKAIISVVIAIIVIVPTTIAFVQNYMTDEEIKEARKQTEEYYKSYNANSKNSLTSSDIREKVPYALKDLLEEGYLPNDVDVMKTRYEVGTIEWDNAENAWVVYGTYTMYKKTGSLYESGSFELYFSENGYLQSYPSRTYDTFEY